MHEVDIFRKRFAERLRHRLDSPIGDQATADLRLNLLLEFVDAALVLVALETLLEVGEIFALALVVLVLFEEPFKDTVEIEVPQRPVQVIRTSDGTAWLHPGV